MKVTGTLKATSNNKERELTNIELQFNKKRKQEKTRPERIKNKVKLIIFRLGTYDVIVMRRNDELIDMDNETHFRGRIQVNSRRRYTWFFFVSIRLMNINVWNGEKQGEWNEQNNGNGQFSLNLNCLQMMPCCEIFICDLWTYGGLGFIRFFYRCWLKIDRHSNSRMIWKRNDEMELTWILASFNFVVRANSSLQ